MDGGRGDAYEGSEVDTVGGPGGRGGGWGSGNDAYKGSEGDTVGGPGGRGGGWGSGNDAYKGSEGDTVGSEFRSCVKVEVAVLGSPSLIVRMVSVDVKQH